MIIHNVLQIIRKVIDILSPISISIETEIAREQVNASVRGGLWLYFTTKGINYFYLVTLRT